MDTTTESDWVLEMRRRMGDAPYVDPLFVLQHSPSIHLVDLRERDEASGLLGHIPGSVFVTPNRLSELANLADGIPIVLVSATGRHAAVVARQLADQGITHVAALLGGVAAWRRVGFGTSRDATNVATEFLPHAASGPAPSGDARRILSLEDVRDHIGDPRTVHWIQLASLLFQAHVSCVDGRDARGVIGTLGGDAGEFVLALAAVERVGRLTLSDDEIRQTLVAYVDTFGDFYLHSDEGALDTLVAALRDHPVIGPATKSITGRAAWIDFLKQPDRALEGPLLDQLTLPAHVGCGHLRLMLQHSDEYDVRTELVEGTIRAFHRLLWAGAVELPFVVLPGSHGEGAVVNIRLADAPWGLGFVPMISPAYEGTSMFVNHADVSAVLRGTAVEFHCRGVAPATVDPSLADALEAEFDRMASRQLTATLGYLAKGLPVYDVVFASDGTFDVRAVG